MLGEQEFLKSEHTFDSETLAGLACGGLTGYKPACLPTLLPASVLSYLLSLAGDGISLWLILLFSLWVKVSISSC